MLNSIGDHVTCSGERQPALCLGRTQLIEALTKTWGSSQLHSDPPKSPSMFFSHFLASG